MAGVGFGIATSASPSPSFARARLENIRGAPVVAPRGRRLLEDQISPALGLTRHRVAARRGASSRATEGKAPPKTSRADEENVPGDDISPTTREPVAKGRYSGAEDGVASVPTPRAPSGLCGPSACPTTTPTSPTSSASPSAGASAPTPTSTSSTRSSPRWVSAPRSGAAPQSARQLPRHRLGHGGEQEEQELLCLRRTVRRLRSPRQTAYSTPPYGTSSYRPSGKAAASVGEWSSGWWTR